MRLLYHILIRCLLREGQDDRLEHLEVGLPIVYFHVLQVVIEEGLDLLWTVLRVQKLLCHGSVLYYS